MDPMSITNTLVAVTEVVTVVATEVCVAAVKAIRQTMLRDGELSEAAEVVDQLQSLPSLTIAT